MKSLKGMFCLILGIAFLLFFSVEARAARIAASWNANTESDLAGYNVYLSASYDNASQLIGDITSFSTTRTSFCYDVNEYSYEVVFIAITAYDTEGLESIPIIGYLLFGNIYGTYNDGVAYTDARVDGQDLSWIGLYFGQTGVTHQQIDCASNFIVEIPDMKQRADLTDGPVIGRIDGYDLMAFCLHFGNTANQ